MAAASVRSCILSILTDSTQPVTGNTDRTQPENRAFFPALDGLRAVAFLMVFLQHYLQIPWGWTGVNIFFVLSGFLITGILYDSQNDPHRARNFYIRRTLRIFPLYYGIFLLLFILHPLVHWHWSLAWLAWPLYFGNLLRFRSPQVTQFGSSQEIAADAHLSSQRFPNSQVYLGHFWSLCVEEQFYLVWPWIVFWLRSRRALLWLCAAAVILVPILRVWVSHVAPTWQLEEELLYRNIPFQLDALLMGGLVALLWRGPWRKHLLFVGKAIAVIAGVCTLVYLARTARPPFFFGSYHYPTWKFTWGLSFIDVFSAALILCCLQPRNWVARLLSLGPLRWVGRISYGAYVWHDILHGLYSHIIHHLHDRFPRYVGHIAFTTTVLALIGTLVVSWLSFRLFETPFLNLKERWTRRTPAALPS